MGVTMMLLDEVTAIAVAGPRLKPRPIAAGPLAGGYALGLAVREDPVHRPAHARLVDAPVIEIDPVLAWPDLD